MMIPITATVRTVPVWSPTVFVCLAVSTCPSFALLSSLVPIFVWAGLWITLLIRSRNPLGLPWIALEFGAIEMHCFCDLAKTKGRGSEKRIDFLEIWFELSFAIGYRRDCTNCGCQEHLLLFCNEKPTTVPWAISPSHIQSACMILVLCNVLLTHRCQLRYRELWEWESPSRNVYTNYSHFMYMS